MINNGVRVIDPAPDPTVQTNKPARSVSIVTLLMTTVLVGAVSFIAGTRSETLIANITQSQQPSSLDLASLNEAVDDSN